MKAYGKILWGVWAMAAAVSTAEAGIWKVQPGGKGKESLEGAIQALADEIEKNGTSKNSRIVELAPGDYVVREGLTVDSSHAGTPEAPTVIRSVEPHKARLMAARPLADAAWSVVADSVLKSRMPAEGASVVVSMSWTNLHGSSVLGVPPGVFIGSGGLPTLLMNEERVPLARWPAEGYTTMKTVLDSGSQKERRGGQFEYRGEEPGKWTQAVKDGLWLAGFWRVPWVKETVRVESIDTTSRTIRFAEAVSKGIGSKYTKEVNGTRAGDGKEPWFAWNLVEGMTPGTWCFDFERQLILYWPKEEGDEKKLSLVDLDRPVVLAANTSYLRLEGLVVFGGLKEGISVSGGEKVSVVNCRILKNGGVGLRVVGGRDHLLQANNLEESGEEGMWLDSGDRPSLTSGGLKAHNNYVRQPGRIRTVSPGVQLSGMGIEFTHNLLCELNNSGIVFQGNEHRIEANEIYHLGLDSGDLGGIYVNGDWAGRGNRILGNLIHHSPNANGIYLDDGHSGAIVTGNVIYRCASGLFIGGGHDHQCSENLVVDCPIGLHVDDRGISRKYNLQSKHHMKYLEEYGYLKPPWSEKYPDLPKMLEKPEYPTGNSFAENVWVGCPRPTRLPAKPEIAALLSLSSNQEFSLEAAKLTDPAKFDFFPGKDSPLAPWVGKKWLEKRPGLLTDEYRTSIPENESKSRFEMPKPRQMFDSEKDLNRSNELSSP
jgi:hypothetical protein